MLLFCLLVPVRWLLCHDVLTYRDLQDELLASVIRLEGIENGRKLVAVEFD
jgi:hypothetical protein